MFWGRGTNMTFELYEKLHFDAKKIANEDTYEFFLSVCK